MIGDPSVTPSLGGNSKPDTVTVTASATASEAATSHRRSPFISAPPPSAASAAHSPPAMADPFAPKTMKRKNKKGLALSAPPPKPASADSDGQGPGGLGNAKEETLEIGVEFQLDLKAEDLIVLRELGSGNGGTVSKVQHAATKVIMARKVLDLFSVRWGTLHA